MKIPIQKSNGKIRWRCPTCDAYLETDIATFYQVIPTSVTKVIIGHKGCDQFDIQNYQEISFIDAVREAVDSLEQE